MLLVREDTWSRRDAEWMPLQVGNGRNVNKTVLACLESEIGSQNFQTCDLA